MARRTHELVFNEDSPDRSYDSRLGFEFTEGGSQPLLVYPSKEYPKPQHLTRADVVALRNFCELVLDDLDANEDTE